VSTALNGNRAIEILGCVLAVGVILTWIFVFSMMIRAVMAKQILWPQKQEDRNEGGWLEGDERMRSSDRAREVSYRQATLRQIQLVDDTQVFRRRTVINEVEEEPEYDRADFAIKEQEMDNLPARGRAQTHNGNEGRITGTETA
jgi:hypothetical protein